MVRYLCCCIQGDSLIFCNNLTVERYSLFSVYFLYLQGVGCRLMFCPVWSLDILEHRHSLVSRFPELSSFLLASLSLNWNAMDVVLLGLRVKNQDLKYFCTLTRSSFKISSTFSNDYAWAANPMSSTYVNMRDEVFVISAV